MPLEGRGDHYTPMRARLEAAMALVHKGAWAARLCGRLGLLSGVRLVEHRVASARWPRGTRPLHVAFASDFHAGPTTHPSLLDAAVARLASLAADVLVLGGDFVYLDASGVEALARRLETVAAPFGKYAVLGNHDLWADDRAITRALEGAGVRVLVNDAVALAPPFEHVSVCGLDEPWTGCPDAAATFRGARDVRVLAMHAPAGLLFVGDQSFDLAVCGHTHGGHIALPSGIPIVVPGLLSRRYAHGEHDLGDGRTLVVSRGVGATEVPLRLFADPDVRSIVLGPHA